ncbi:hypothetical protein [Eubacterium sp. 1001713B170207_170306_E7]|uniref:hypothetical protein n=1 Tax=Eubacterium sp. 1001713B170207_170306_E7 TaxID=2787097 RepID=UPI001896D745|nr:hypothetical protein [Eubacterium sp. 1001713B170207_170306_E7]
MKKRTLVEIACGIVVLFILIALINQMYPRDKRELIPDSAIGFISTDYAKDYVQNVTDLMEDVRVLGFISNEGVTDITRNTDKKQEKLDAYERSIDSFLNGYKSDKNQESNALFNKLVELGELGKRAIAEMRVVYNTQASDEDRIQSAGNVRDIYDAEFVPLDRELANYVNIVNDKYQFEN